MLAVLMVSATRAADTLADHDVLMGFVFSSNEILCCISVCIRNFSYVSLTLSFVKWIRKISWNLFIVSFKWMCSSSLKSQRTSLLCCFFSHYIIYNSYSFSDVCVQVYMIRLY